MLASKCLPIYNVSLIVLSTTYGAIFYEEYKQLKPLGMILFPVGVGFIASGVLLLIVTAESREATEVSNAGHASPKSGSSGGGRERSRSELYGPTGSPCPFGADVDDTDVESESDTAPNTPGRSSMVPSMGLASAIEMEVIGVQQGDDDPATAVQGRI